MSAGEVRILQTLDGVASADWDALHDGRNPFVSHAFLDGLERHGCLRREWGWTPHHVTLWNGDRLLAAAPGYLKGNSHGEFVFDHAWAHAYARHGREYFPKWLGAVPYSPVSGPRLLAADDALKPMLLSAIITMTRQSGLSSAHVNFPDAIDSSAFGGEWMARLDVQYHWRNSGQWADFEGFLASMDHKHRKNIRQERAKVARAGVRFRTIHGNEASDDDLAAMYGFYLQTFAEYGNSPALTLEFLRHLADSMPRGLVIFIAEQAGDAIAGALCLRGGDTLYGRYWGSIRELPGLHFETCYYQGIDYSLREGLHRFEPGAQGEHKVARGFLPAFVHSKHWIADQAFAEPLRQWCADEGESVRQYAAMLADRSPFKTSA